MKKSGFTLLIITALFAACSTPKKVVSTANTTTEKSAATADGLSIENAVVTKSIKDLQSVNEEYAWIRQHYPGAKTKSQSLVHKNNKSYDILNIVTADGKEKALYFDITAGFGHF